VSPQPRVTVGLVSLGIGLAAAGVGAALGVAAERVAVGRPLLPPFAWPDDDGEDYTGLHTPAQAVPASDATLLHVEVEQADPQRADPALAGVTVVFSHGYALTMDSWYFQRKALRGRYRLVFWDQRGHGRSGTGPPGSATIDQVGRDLAAVLDEVAPAGPLVLIGHSMGGMTVMALADQRPELFADRVLGVALVSTSAGGLGDIDLGVAGLGRLVQRIAPGTVKALTRTPRLVEHGRRLASDLESVLVRRYSYASPVSGALVRFTAQMIASTRLEVISDFLPTFSEHDKRAALAVLDGLEVLVLVGDKDLLIPARHSEQIVQQLPGAEHVVVRDGGHLVMLEHPDVVTGHLGDLIERASRSHGRQAEHLRMPRVRRTVTSLRRRRRNGAA
jgi:pimeloyl-ACP methyl ester carboxylesterase